VSERPLILVIEDEYFLRTDMERVLTEVGFATEIVSSGEAALKLLMDDNKRPNALVTDVTLAGRLTGWEVAKRVREKDPSFSVIYARIRGSEQHRHPKAIRASAAGDRRFQSSQQQHAADNVRSPRCGKAPMHGQRTRAWAMSTHMVFEDAKRKTVSGMNRSASAGSAALQAAIIREIAVAAYGLSLFAA
jgi:CheY-like chemotaxis protein